VTAEERLDRLESLAMIRQLPQRYALAVDSRDVRSLVALFVPDVRVGRDRSGRAALEEWFSATLGTFHGSIHFVGDHVISFDDADHARGVVYCRDELDRRDAHEWHVGMLQYWDTYERVDDEWCFERRVLHRWYIDDAQTRPTVERDVSAAAPPPRRMLPESFSELDRFWRGER